MVGKPLRALESGVPPSEERAQAAARRFWYVAGRLEACKPVGSVGRWDDIVACAHVLAEAVEHARDEAVVQARAVAAARREQLMLLPPGSVVEEDERPPLQTCWSCDRESRAKRCVCGVWLR